MYKPILIIFIAGIMLFRTPFAVGSDWCFEEAGEYYAIAPELLKAISKVESNFDANAVNKNKNGSTDFCHMQINSQWKKVLGDDWFYLDDPCYCTKVGAWILNNCIQQFGYDWDAVACYNTGCSLSDDKKKKRELGVKYVQRVIKALNSLNGRK